MLKDHVDLDALAASLAAYVRGEGPKPASVATWRRARDGERCDGCGETFKAGVPVQVAYADGSVGHPECHAGMPRGTGMRVRTLRGPNPFSN